MLAYLRLPHGAPAALPSDARAVAALVLDGGEGVEATIAGLRASAFCPRLLVRAPDVEGAGENLRAIVAARPDALVLPFADGRDVAALGARLAVEEAEAGLPDGGVGIVAVAACPAAVLAVSGLAGASPRLRALSWDADALARSIGARAVREGEDWTGPLAQARALVRLAAATAGVTAIEAPYEGRDAAGCRRAVQAARRDGFAAMMARDPAQVALIAAAS